MQPRTPHLRYWVRIYETINKIHGLQKNNFGKMSSMCGICGSANSNGETPKKLDQAVEALKYRGPDDQGMYVGNQISLGHTRLAIQDGANAKQPMVSHSGRYVLVFNGEIYNHFELRGLIPHHPWKTESDTETVLELFEILGESVISQFVGMYAFGIWDTQKNTLTLSRDPNGEKPIFYSILNGEICFASEARIVAFISGLDGSLDPKALPEVLKYGYLNPKKSFINGVSPLMPGEILTWSNENVSIKPRGNLDRSDIQPRNKFQSIREFIETAVHRTLLADEKVGVMLSGGIDSSIIAAIAAKHVEGLPTFTFALTQDSADARFAQLMSDRIKSDHHVITINPEELADEIERIVTSLPQPFADSAVIPTNLLSEIARSKVKVLVSGDGADEMFAGYGYYEKYRNKEVTGKIDSFAREGLYYLLKNSRYKKINKLRDNFKESKLTSRRSTIQESWDEDLAAFTNFELGEMLGIKNFAVHKGSINLSEKKPTFWNVLQADREYYLTGNILQKSDLGGMLGSIEIRAPYLDRDLDRYLRESISDPQQLTKKILYSACSDLIPDSIFERKKMGFGAPLDEWFSNKKVNKLVDSVIRNENARIYQHFDFEKSIQSIEKTNLRKWNFFVLALWLEKNESR